MPDWVHNCGRGGRSRAPLARWAIVVGLALVPSVQWVSSARAELVVAVAVPGASGTGAPAGADSLADGARAASDRLNAAGGILGDRVKVVRVEDACSSDGGTLAADALIAQAPALVLGHPCGSAAIAAARRYAAAKTLFVAIGPRQPQLTDKRAGPLIFRFAGRDDRQGHSAGSWLAARFPRQPVAIVSDRTLYARKLVEQARAALLAAGSPDLPIVPIVAGERDYPSAIAQLQQLRPAAVYFAGFPLEAASLLNGMRKAGMGAAFFASDAVATSEFAARFPDAADSQPIWTARPLRPASAQEWSALGELTVLAWAAAVQEGGSPSADVVAQRFQASGGQEQAEFLRSRLGRFGIERLSFDAKGDAAIPSYEVRRVIGGALVDMPK